MPKAVWLLATLLLKDRTLGQPITRAPSVFQVMCNLPPVPRVRPRAQRPNCPGHVKAWAVSLLLPQPPSRWPYLLCMVGTSGFGSWALSSKHLVDPSLEYITICNICKCVTFEKKCFPGYGEAHPNSQHLVDPGRKMGVILEDNFFIKTEKKRGRQRKGRYGGKETSSFH